MGISRVLIQEFSSCTRLGVLLLECPSLPVSLKVWWHTARLAGLVPRPFHLQVSISGHGAWDRHVTKFDGLQDVLSARRRVEPTASHELPIAELPLFDVDHQDSKLSLAPRSTSHTSGKLRSCNAVRTVNEEAGYQVEMSSGPR
jgi:hypothetical protein